MLSPAYESFVNSTACELFGFDKKKEESKKDVKVKKVPDSYDVRSIKGFDSAKSFMIKNVELMKKKAINAASKMLPKFDSAFFKNLYNNEYENSDKFSSSNQLQLFYKPINRMHLNADCTEFPWIHTGSNKWCVVVYVYPDKEYERIFDDILYIDPGDEKYSCYYTYAYEIGTEKEYIWRGDDKDQRILASRLTKAEYDKFASANDLDSAMEFFGFGKKKEPEKKNPEKKESPYNPSSKEIKEAEKEIISEYSSLWKELEKSNLSKLLKGTKFLTFDKAMKITYNFDSGLTADIWFDFDVTPEAQKIINNNSKDTFKGLTSISAVHDLKYDDWETHDNLQ